MRQSLFLCANNERGRIPAPSDNSVNLPFTYAIYFFFLRGQKEKVPKRKKPPTKTPAPLPAKGLTKRL